MTPQAHFSPLASRQSWSVSGASMPLRRILVEPISTVSPSTMRGTPTTSAALAFVTKIASAATLMTPAIGKWTNMRPPGSFIEQSRRGIRGGLARCAVGPQDNGLAINNESAFAQPKLSGSAKRNICSAGVGAPACARMLAPVCAGCGGETLDVGAGRGTNAIRDPERGLGRRCAAAQADELVRR